MGTFANNEEAAHFLVVKPLCSRVGENLAGDSVELYGSLSSPALRAGSVNSGPGGGRVGYPTRHGPPLTTSKISSRIKENFDVSTLTEDAMREINEKITLRTRFNSVVTGVPGFIPKAK